MMVIAPLVWIVLAQAPTVSLTGTVVGPGGKPVVGADLVLVGLPSFEAPIVARGKSGDGGRFTLERPATLAGDHHPQRAPIFWAVKPGYLASITRFPEAMPKPDEPVRVALQPPGKAEVRVESPDGKPATGDRILIGRLKTEYTYLPDEVAELAAATTGPDGVAVLDAFSQAELTYLDAHAPGLGIQGRNITPRADRPVVIALRVASSWKGRLVADDPKYAKGWKVRAWTRAGGGTAEKPTPLGYAEATTDEEGRFALKPMAMGSLQLTLKPPGDLPVMADMAVKEGQEISAEIPLKSPDTITGLFLERGMGKPIPGVSATLIYIGERSGSEQVKTDERGRYTFKGLPGLVRVGHFNLPKTHVMAPGKGFEDFTVPEPPRVIELATREIIPAAPRSGAGSSTRPVGPPPGLRSRRPRCWPGRATASA